MEPYRNVFKSFIVGCLFILCTPYSFGQQIQKTSNIWHFGSFAGLDFNQSPPVGIPNGRIDTQEGVASVSDADGNLLFYSDGSSIWDKNHERMPNGTNLRGHESSTQSAIIVPLLTRPNFYYIFTVDELAGPGGLSYSVVNMNLTGNGNVNSPLGDVEPDEKNILLTAPVTEKVTAVLKPDNKSYWVITHLWNSDEFHAYEVDCNGLNSNPVVSKIGTVHSGGTINAVGYMKASFNGERIALVNRRNNTVEVFDFNKETGELSNDFIFSPNSSSLYGLEFTPNGEHLFIGGTNTLERFTFTNNQLTDIAIDDMSPFNGNNAIRALQLGPDLNIYVSIRNLDYISVIKNPESASPLLVTEDIFLDIDNQGRSCQFGLPNLFFFDVTIPDTVQFSACASTQIEYEGAFFDAGTETAAQVEQSDGCFSTVIVRVLETETYEGEKEVLICEGESYMINNIEIPIGAQELIILPNANGCDSTLLVTVLAYPPNEQELAFETCAGIPFEFNGVTIPPNTTETFSFTDGNGCDSMVTVSVNEVSLVVLDIMPNDEACPGDSFTLMPNPLDPDDPNTVINPDDLTDWIWSTNSGTIEPSDAPEPLLTIGQQDAVISVSALYMDCPVEGTITISVTTSPPPLNLPNATTICAGEEVNLNSASVGDLNGYTYTWTSTSTNDGLAGQENDPNPIVSPLVETTYTVLLSHPECGDIFQEVTIDVYDAFDSLLALTFSGCQGEQITVSIEDQDFDLGPNGSITWRPEQAGNQVQDELSFNLILSQNITYTIEVKNDCITAPQEIGSAEIIVQQIPPIAITCEPDLDEYAEGTEIELTVSPSDPSITYTWSSENDGLFSMNPSASTVYTATSTGQGLAQDSDVITVIADINGCTNSATKNFTTVLPDVIVMLPNIFTPGQTENSVFKIRANIEGLINVMNLQIYDRWGNKVYDNDNAQQEWDGNIGGKPAASDVYIYTVTYQIPGQDVVTGSSDLTLLR